MTDRDYEHERALGNHLLETKAREVKQRRQIELREIIAGKSNAELKEIAESMEIVTPLDVQLRDMAREEIAARKKIEDERAKA